MQGKQSKVSGRAGRRSRDTPTLQSDPLFSAAEFSAGDISGAASGRPSNAVSPTASSRRRRMVLPMCMSRSQHDAAVSAFATPRALSRDGWRNTVVNAGGFTTVLTDELPENVERAVQMLTTYPLMKVVGTAFENSLRTTYRRSTLRASRGGSVTSAIMQAMMEEDGSGGEEDTHVNSGPTSMNTSVMLESSAVIQSVLDDSAVMAGDSSRDVTAGAERSQAVAMAAFRTRPDNMVRLAAALKRASMWQAIVVNAVAHTVMTEDFRTLRLRNALETHLLPTLLKRKENTGSIVDHDAVKSVTAKRRRSLAGRGGGSDSGNAASPKESGSEAPTSTYLREHSAFFAELGNSVLLDSLANVMSRFRFVSGEVIASADEPSEVALYFLVSGKCECRMKPQGKQDRPTSSHRTVSPRPAAEGGSAAPGSANTTRPQRPAGSGASRGAHVRVLYSGESFGGIFNSNATFQGTYKAISQCILWVLRADDFERIFKGFADRTMIEQYVAALREHTAEQLAAKHPISSVLPRTPIYRVLNQPLNRYTAEFEPLVMVRGEKLFDQGDAAGHVYCLVEGSVCRSIKGENGTYAAGASQELHLNSFAGLQVPGRCVLLGEEPHILPCTQRYRCVVSSRAAMLFKVPGERFVSALLDDPKLFVSLRERLSSLYVAQMKLDPACLGFAPLLRQFPSSSLQTLVQAAEPRVYGRSVAISEPAQALREFYLVTYGDVRDPRVYGHHPTKPMPTPPPSEDDEDDAEATGGAAGDRSVNTRIQMQRAHGLGGKEKESGKGHKGGKKAAHKAEIAKPLDANLGGSVEEEEKDWMTSSFFSEKGLDLAGGSTSLDATGTFGGNNTLSSMGGSGGRFLTAHARQGNGRRGGKQNHLTQSTQLGSSWLNGTRGGLGDGAAASPKGGDKTAVVSPDEQLEFNPPLPVLATKRFLFTLGGGWEGLLLDKWPNGWGTASLVEAWAIPTAKLRVEFNSCSKATQSAILLAAREQQKSELGLPSLSTAKLPPMSVYHQAPAPVAEVAPNATDGKRKPSTLVGANHHAKRTVRSTSTHSAEISVKGSPGIRGTHGNKTRGSTSGVGSARNSGIGTEMLSFSSSSNTIQPGHLSPSGGRNRDSLDSGKLYGVSAAPAEAPQGEGDAKAASQAVGYPAALKRASTRKSVVSVVVTASPAAKGPSASRRVTINPTAASKAIASSANLTAGQLPPVQQRPAERVASGKRPSPAAERPALAKTGTSTLSGAGGHSGDATAPNTAAATPSRNLLALYNGEFRDDEMLLYSNIVREPAAAHKKPRTANTAKRGAVPGTSLSAALWPDAASSTVNSTGWFREVPVREPLPGTTPALGETLTATQGSTLYAKSLPLLATNTALLTRAAPGHAQALQAQADFFSATNAARMAAGGGESPSRTPRNKSDRTPVNKKPNSAASRLELPKRHALIM